MKTILAILLVLLLTGCTTYQEATTPQSEDTGRIIVIRDYRFSPQTVTIPNGTMLTWRNLDRDAHSVHFNGEESKKLDKGETFSVLPVEPGKYHYYSANHPFINGTVIVE